MRAPRFPLRTWSAGSALLAAGWAALYWMAFGWRLGYPSFWDPDEATYAQTAREMLATHNWVVPTYDGRPFFDKPPLFYVLQVASFSVTGATETAARLVPLLSALALAIVVVWCGRHLLSPRVGWTGALMLSVLPATFALSNYAIVDMTFTLFLFGGAALVTVSAVHQRPRLQYGGYVLLAAAALTKGPLALALVGSAFLVALVVAPAVRQPLWRLRWGRGLLIIAGLSAPWFIYMWRRFGGAFVDGYLLQENLWLYARPLYSGQPSYLFYPRVMATGLLPWTPILVGRLVDAARGARLLTAERLLWAWTLAILGFFSFSSFKLDHYVFPAAPALCLLAAAAWEHARQEGSPHAGTLVGIACIPVLLIAAGGVLIPGLDRVPLDLPPAARLLAGALIVSGLAMIGQLAQRWRPSSAPYHAAAGLLGAYVCVAAVGLPAFERAKPTRRLAAFVAQTAGPDDHVGMFRLNRWGSSWRFYVSRHSDALETQADLRRFFATPGRHWCAMLQRDYDRLQHSGIRLQVVRSEAGLFTTTGRTLQAGARPRLDQFIVVTDPPPN